MSKLKEFIGKLLHSDTILKILAVLMAIGFWFYIVTFTDSERTKTYQDIPVAFAYEGTAPYNNGLMPLVTSRSYNVSVQVSGQRADLLNFSKDEIYVYFDFSGITDAGRYKVPLVVTSNDPGITATIKGEDEVLMEFTESATKNINISLKTTGDYSPGYEEINRLISPKSITISGPKDVIEKVSFAEVQDNVSNQNKSIAFLSNILLLADTP